MSERPYVHVVLFALRDPADVPEAAARLKAMGGKIPSLRSIEVGIDDQPSPRSAHLALVTRFDGPEGLAEYQVHPVHQDLLAWIGPRIASAVKADYFPV